MELGPSGAAETQAGAHVDAGVTGSGLTWRATTLAPNDKSHGRSRSHAISLLGLMCGRNGRGPVQIGQLITFLDEVGCIFYGSPDLMTFLLGLGGQAAQ